MRAIRMFLWMTLLTGVAYPLLITAIAQLTMRNKAEGSLLLVEGKPIGSRLIAQQFQSDRYFWPRPSAVNYNPLPSGGSNLGPTSLILKKLVSERKTHIVKAQGGDNQTAVPSELLYASGSGLDPHISDEAAYFQVDRIAKARQMNESDKTALYTSITEHVYQNQLGFMGGYYVNVLELNMMLNDQLSRGKR